MIGLKSIQITPKMLRQISEIDEFKGLWTGLDRHTTGLKMLADVFEYGQDLNRLLKPLHSQKLNSDVVCILHASLIGHKGKSAFRSGNEQLSFMRDGEAFGALEVTDVSQIQPFLNKLCEWVNEALEQGELHPLIIVSVFSAVFLQIMPFDMGNWRLVRFLIMLILLKAGYSYVPFVSLSKIMDEHIDEIYAALKENQASLDAGTPSWGRWIDCILDVLLSQKTVLAERIDAKEVELPDMSALSMRIMALFKEHQRLQMNEIIKLTRGRRATIKLRLTELLAAGYLRRHGQGRGTWYSLV